MKKLAFLILSVCTMLINVYGQPTLELCFTAGFNEQWVSLDSILIKNLTKGVDTILYAPDTVLLLDFATSISNDRTIGKSNLTVSQNYPNPFTDRTTINIYLPEKEKIEIIIRDMLGRKVGFYESTLNGGNHTYTFYPGNEKFYLFTVIGEYESQTIKMLNANNNHKFAAKCKIVYTAYDETKMNFKYQKAVNNFVFEYGDNLRYFGFAKTIYEVKGSDVIEDAPQTSELYEFDITEGIPCLAIPTLTYGGQVYNTVQIGDQCWMKENLNIGNMIPRTNLMTDDGIIEKYCYNNNPSACEITGGLYQWDEMMQYTTTQGIRGICPMGWHLPTDDEWKSLEMHLGMSQTHADSVGYRGTDEAKKMKTISGWNYNGNGTNSSGFSSLPGGYHNPDGSVMGFGNLGYWWSTTEYNSNRSWVRVMTDNDKVYRYYFGKYCGFSVRCIKDN